MPLFFLMTARKLADNSRSVTVVASATDILAMLTVRSQPEQTIFLVKPGTLGKTDKVFAIQHFQEKMCEMKNVILFLPAIQAATQRRQCMVKERKLHGQFFPKVNISGSRSVLSILELPILMKWQPTVRSL